MPDRNDNSPPATASCCCTGRRSTASSARARRRVRPSSPSSSTPRTASSSSSSPSQAASVSTTSAARSPKKRQTARSNAPSKSASAAKAICRANRAGQHAAYGSLSARSGLSGLRLSALQQVVSMRHHGHRIRQSKAASLRARRGEAGEGIADLLTSEPEGHSVLTSFKISSKMVEYVPYKGAHRLRRERSASCETSRVCWRLVKRRQQQYTPTTTKWLWLLN